MNYGTNCGDSASDTTMAGIPQLVNLPNQTLKPWPPRGVIGYLPFCFLLASTCTLLASFILCTRKKLRESKNLPLTTIKDRSSVFNPPNVWTFLQIEDATENFNINKRFLGKGRYSTVYEAIFPDGQVMAVKRIDPSLVLSHAPVCSLSEEIRIVSRAQHPNIVPVLGFCEAPAERILVMELMPMKTLQYHLHEGGTVFDWCDRLRIAKEAAEGIAYLHEGMDPCIIHGDIKASNILLDLTWSARVSDFGLSFLAHPGEKFGTDGYLDPRCCHARLDEFKANDVYCFGLLLLEILSGKPMRSGEDSILGWAVILITNSRAHQIFDPKLQPLPNPDPLIRAAELACQCLNEVSSNRPTIMEVIAMLNKIRREIIMDQA